jgi:hypothetical protein
MEKTERNGIELGTQHTLCLHVENGNGPMAKFCIKDQQCQNCAFDQWIEAMAEGQKANSICELTKNILAKAA